MRRVFALSSATLAVAAALLVGCDQKPAGNTAAGSGKATTAQPTQASETSSTGDAPGSAAPGSAATGEAAAHDCSAHKAPRGGTLVPLGNHFAHLEVLLDKETGRLDIYVLDGHAEHAVRSKTGKLDLTVRITENAGGPVADPKPISLIVPGVGSALSGETADDTSHFSLTSNDLIGATKIDATLVRIGVKGEELSAIRFSHPK